MNIVFIGPFGLRPKMTMSIRALPMAKALVARGHTVKVLIPPWDDPERAGQSWEDGGVQVVNVSLPAGSVSRLPLLFHIRLIQTLVSNALALSPDVVHCFKPKAYAGLSHLILWWLRRRQGLSLRLVLDADDWEQAWNDILPYSAMQKMFFTWQERWGPTHADAVTVASRSLEELLARQAGIDRSSIFYVPNGLNNDAVDSLSKQSSNGNDGRATLGWGDAPTVLLYTRFTEFRLDRIVTLVGEVAEQLPQARWLIIGQGWRGEEKTLEMTLVEAGLNQYVKFAGWVPVDQLPAYFKAADVAIYPYDDTPLNRAKCSVKLIDLMAAGLPVVADAVGQNCEYIQHDRSGILVPPEDDVAFGQALITLLQAPELRQRLGQTAMRHIETNFTWPYLVRTVERAYH